MKRKTVSEKRIEIRGMRGGGAVIQTLGKKGGGLQNNFFWALRASVWSKNGGGGGSPGSATVINIAIACFELGLFLLRF